MIACARCGRNCETNGLYAGEAWDPPEIMVESYRMEDAPAFCVPCSLWRAAGLFTEVQKAQTFIAGLFGEDWAFSIRDES